jgi:hypothetical protein
MVTIDEVVPLPLPEIVAPSPPLAVPVSVNETEPPALTVPVMVTVMLIAFVAPHLFCTPVPVPVPVKLPPEVARELREG